MAIVKTFTPGENTFLLVWKITEDVSTLTNFLTNVHDNQTLSPKHSLHWLSSRAALVHFFGEDAVIHITKDQFNKPAMMVNGSPYHLSITHSNNYAAVLFSQTRSVALDLEKIDERVERVSHKFVNSAEAEMLEKSENRALDLTLIWSSKETLYKHYGIKELDFKQHMTVFINQPTLRGCIHKLNPTFFELNSERIDEFVLTYLVS